MIIYSRSVLILIHCMILLYLANAVGATQRQTAQTPLAIPVIRSQIDAPIRDRD